MSVWGYGRIEEGVGTFSLRKCLSIIERGILLVPGTYGRLLVSASLFDKLVKEVTAVQVHLHEKKEFGKWVQRDIQQSQLNGTAQRRL